MALPLLKPPFGFSLTAAIVVHEQRWLVLLGDDSAPPKIVRGTFDVLSASIESDNKAHTSLVDGYGSATIKVPGKYSADKNGVKLFAGRER